MAKQYKIYICGGDYRRVDDRDPCPDPLHDWPLPSGYVDASAVADARIAARWSNRKCRRCGLHGWAPSGTEPYKESLNAVHVPYDPDLPKKHRGDLPGKVAEKKTIKTVTLPMENQ